MEKISAQHFTGASCSLAALFWESNSQLPSYPIGPSEAERSAVRSSQFSDQLDDINPTLAARWQLWAANHMTGIFQECGELARRVASLLSVRLHQRTFAPARYRVSR